MQNKCVYHKQFISNEVLSCRFDNLTVLFKLYIYIIER